MTTWEYVALPVRTKISINRRSQEKNAVILNVEEDLNALGEEGWELVSVQNVRLETGSLFTVAYLKREKQ
ncbi:MAG: hypothetical protein ACOWW1_08580 [archaeon]|nr:DUF4177 domain-containing protein [Candidatus Bathyarchaeum sp.]